MSLTDFSQNALLVNVALFAASAAFVWVAGTRIARYADAVARVTGLGHAVVGIVLLAGVTSLPEVAVTVTASLGGNGDLAVNNLVGSVAMQVTLLAVADAMIGRDALTSVIVDPAVLIQLALNVILFTLLAGAIVVGDVALAGAGVWTWGLAFGYVVSIWVIAKTQGRKPWQPGRISQPEGSLLAGAPDAAGSDDAGGSRGSGEPRRSAEGRVPKGLMPQSDAEDRERAELPLSALAWRIALAAATILVAGYLLSKTGESIARSTGLGQSMGGFLLVAVATSLPEISTVVESVRLRRYVMAMSDIFGTNLFNAGLVFVVDVVYRGPPVLSEVGNFAAFASLLSVLVTAIFLIGLLERRDRTVLRMGWDSLAVLVCYGGGVALLFSLKGGSA